MPDEVVKLVVSVTEMARLVGLSRARFYQCVKAGTFPPADTDPLTKRPFYGEEKQRQCLEVRRRNCGIDGRPVLFYSRRRDFGVKKSKPPATTPKVKVGEYADLIAMLAQVKVQATASQVEAAVREKFPSGTIGKDIAVVFKAILPVIRGQDRPDSAG
jgi:hypothetical protein